MNNLLLLDETLNYLNTGEPIDQVRVTLESAEIEINTFNSFLESMNADIVVTEGIKSAWETIKKKIKEFIEKAKNFIEEVIFQLQYMVKAIKAYGAGNFLKRDAVIAYAKLKRIPDKELDEILRGKTNYIEDDREISFIENCRDLRNNVVMLTNSVDAYGDYCNQLNVVTGDLLAKKFFAWGDVAEYRDLDSSYASMNKYLDNINPDSFKLVKKTRKDISDNDVNDSADIYKGLSVTIQDCIGFSLLMKKNLKGLEKLSNKTPQDDNEKVTIDNAKMILGYFTKGISIYSKIYSALVKVNKVTYSAMTDIIKANIDGYAKARKAGNVEKDK